MVRICKILGHKWDESKPLSESADQKCLRKNCLAHRKLMWNRFPKIGEPSLSWRIIDYNEIFG